MKNYLSILLIAGILLLINVLSNQYFFRMDLTEDKQYTLSNATKDILKGLEDPVTVKAYFSEDLPPDIARTKREFREMLTEYANISKGMVDYEFVDPSSTPELEQEALQAGVRPVMINVREKDQSKQQKAFLGAVLNMGESKDVIPFMQPGTAMEYALSTSIKKLSVADKPSVGIIQGHGEPPLSELSQVFTELSILYSVENVDLNTEEQIPDRFKTIALLRPTDSIPPAHFQKLDNYLARGGNLFVGVNAVDGNLQNAQGTAITTGLETWLKDKGIEVENNFLVDANCGNVSVQQRQGFFTINTPIQFPFLPVIKSFPEHPINKGLEQVILPFASPIRYVGGDNASFTSIATSSSKAGIVKAPTYFDVTNKKWNDSDFPLSNLDVAGVLEGSIVGDVPSKIVVIGDGDFPITGQQGRGQGKNNISLMVNGIDWLSDDTGLIELRTKGVATRPIEDLEEGKRSMLKYLNFGLPIVLIIIYGIFRSQRNKNRRLKRMQESYA